LTVNLSAFVDDARELLPNDTSIASESMPGIEVGTEFDNYSCIKSVCSPQASSVNFHWSVSSLSLTGSTTYHIVG
jgi:hypothetical protein